jgi:transcriptional regulator with PAS, ATPase and Fis domain
MDPKPPPSRPQPVTADAHGEVITRVLESSQTITVPAIELRVVDGPDRGAALGVSAGAARIGTAPGCDLRLGDPTVSRLHCEIRGRREGFSVVDLGSTNGTFVDGVRVQSAQLVSGATVRVGATVLRAEVGDQPSQVQLSRRVRFGEVIGASVEMRRIYAIMERVAPTDATVLIQGETGTGKELVARAIHDASRRAAGPFVTIDCGAIAEQLISSELFGHVKGAFSGAVEGRRGLFEEASGGTLFLDEIGELPAALQPQLLRVLEAREVRPVGGNATRRVDVRVLAATHRSLAQGVNDRTFREDLYYRLAVVELALPPLRARREDILLLARHLYARFAGDDAPFPTELSSTLLGRAWPGNVRELRNFIERTVSLGWTATGAGGGGAPAAVPPGLEALVPTHLPLKEARALWTERFEVLYVSALLRRAGGNVTRAATLAGVERRSLQRIIAQHGLRDAGGDDDDG